jgi:hypothetical protein
MAASDPESGIGRYQVYRGTSSGAGKTLLGEVSSAILSASDTETAANTIYYYEVTAVNGAGLEGLPSNEAVAVTGDVPPAAPTGLTAGAGGDDVVLDWADNVEQDLAGYRVYRSMTSGGPYSPVGPALVTSSALTDAGLVPGTTYYYVVAAVDMSGFESGWSTEASAAVLGISSPTWYWTLDEGAGTVAADTSGHGAHGTLVNGASWTTGLIEGGLRFDGVDDYVSTTFAQNLPAWTVAIWVRSPATPANAVASGPVQREKNFQINWNHSDSRFRGAVALRVGGSWYPASFGSLGADTWYHLAASYDGETLRAYRDGVLVASNTAPSGPPDAETKPLLFGRQASRAQFFAGTIDDVRLYDRALDASDIAALAAGSGP